MKSSFERKINRALEGESSGRIKKGIKNRAPRKPFANKLSILGFIIFFATMFICLYAPLSTQYNSTKVDPRNTLSPPTASHIMGTDKIDRNIWARVLYGGRISIGVGLGSALIATVLGAFLGIIAGYKGGWFDGITMKISEILVSFPQIILILILVTITGQSLWNPIFVSSITGWFSMYRMARSQMLSLREEEYVQALKAFGIGSMRIAFVYMPPNAIGPISVNMTFSTAIFILQEASLSFLGLGVPLEVTTWNNILNMAQDLMILKNFWWVWLLTDIVVTLFVVGINFIGDDLRDAMDPSQIE